MFKLKALTALLFVKSLFCPCHTDKKTTGFEKGNRHYQYSRLGKLPEAINESSGLTLGSDSVALLTINDSGGRNAVYQVFREGTLDSVWCCFGKNVDWEALTSDPDGNVYIGDIGNNRNRRRDLTIYKVAPGVDRPEVITFELEDQDAFPPPKDEMDFDLESLFFYHDSLYVASKNRGTPCVKLYAIPAVPGHHTARIRQIVQLKGMVTAGAISPDGTTVGLLSYGRIYLFDNVAAAGVRLEPRHCLRFARGGQSEGLVFINNTDFIISNENRTLFLVEKKR